MPIEVLLMYLVQDAIMPATKSAHGQRDYDVGWAKTQGSCLEKNLFTHVRAHTHTHTHTAGGLFLHRGGRVT